MAVMTESMPENDIIIEKNVKESAYPKANVDIAATADATTDRKKKKSGAFGIFKAALLIFRKRQGQKSSAKINLKPEQDGPTTNNPNPNWTKLVDSVRPLHVQESTQSPPQSPVAPAEEAGDEIREMIVPTSPAGSSSSGSTCRGMSKYASAASLLDLDNSSDEEEEDPDEVFDALTGDEMIDAKAEEFIAQFYKQMQLQRTSRTRHHQHNLSRGI
ncbi:hypothetical protein CASFOL_002592 [Castilleja foliolosa]|uniref:Uncharacterized protein n=1 Tax=Castilleja foliolosa TaxID=1961234 RepID=A0ABD3EF11_9LAMI